MTTLPPDEVRRLKNALPFWLSLGTIPVVAIAAHFGGWALALIPAYTWGLYAILDQLTGLNEENADLSTPEADLFWYRLITLIWFPIQFALLVWMFQICYCHCIANVDVDLPNNQIMDTEYRRF